LQTDIDVWQGKIDIHSTQNISHFLEKYKGPLEVTLVLFGKFNVPFVALERKQL